jgi:two-component system, chemotaxis family, chemotaxis protein CheY
MSWSILIVDDSHFIRSQLRIAFEAKGARVIEAENGSEGLWRAREHSIDLMVVDVHMPVMDGLRMIQEARKLPEHARTPIFVLTTDAAGCRADEGKKVGATAWMLKPVNPELLWKGIEKVLHRAAPEAPEAPAKEEQASAGRRKE